MTVLLIQIGLSNACIALALAIVALVVEATVKRPQLAHLLWLLVFIKLVTPPLVSIPIVTTGGLTDNTTVIIQDHSQLDIDEKEISATSNIFVSETEISPLAKIKFLMLDYGKAWLPPIWLLGIMVVFAWSMVRVFRFHRLLTLGSEIAPQKLQTVAAGIASRLGLKSVPTIYTTSAPLSPLVWWLGGKVRIVIPTVLLEQMDTQQFEWVMAHELAHVRRRDYLVRWIEWLACVCFWWNPLVWWARHRLRASEEICCDVLVVSSLKPEPHSYANLLLTAIEYLVRPVLRPPAIASEINSGGFLERRFKMIMSENFQRKNAHWLQLCVLLLAVVVLPLSMAFAQDGNDKTEAYLEQVSAKLQGQVQAGNMTAEDAEAKMAAIQEQIAAKAEANAHLEQIWETLQTQVEAGNLTAEDAETMMAAVKKKYADQADRAKYEAVAAKIRAAMEAGEITAEEGRKKMYAFKARFDEREKKEKFAMMVKEIKAAEIAGEITPEETDQKIADLKKRFGWGENEDRKVDWEGIKRRIEGAVEAGKMTREEADAKYDEIKARMSRGDRDEGIKKRYAAAEKEIKAAVEAGKITEEEAEEKMVALRKRIAASHERGDRGANQRARYTAAVEKIKAVVDAGEITEEEAKAKWAAIRKKSASKKNIDYEAIGRRIKAAVEAGEMTEEEAKAKWVAIKKKSSSKETK